jgi:Arc/MetJ-type ribon-helix-helix transcriptional regulator
MVFGMATQKITVTVEDDQLRQIRALVDAGQASSVSGFVKHAIRIALFDAAGWRQMLRDALQETGGPLTADERKWADANLSPRPPRKNSKKSKAA